MRFMMTFFVLSLSAMLFVGCETTQRAGTGATAYADQTTPIETSTATLVVHGMGCPLCANNVDKQLLTVPGVTDVNINLGNGEVKVHLAPANRPSRQQLARAVDQSGFTLVSINTP